MQVWMGLVHRRAVTSIRITFPTAPKAAINRFADWAFQPSSNSRYSAFAPTGKRGCCENVGSSSSVAKCGQSAADPKFAIPSRSSRLCYWKVWGEGLL